MLTGAIAKLTNVLGITMAGAVVLTSIASCLAPSSLVTYYLLSGRGAVAATPLPTPSRSNSEVLIVKYESKDIVRLKGSPELLIKTVLLLLDSSWPCWEASPSGRDYAIWIVALCQRGEVTCDRPSFFDDSWPRVSKRLEIEAQIYRVERE